MRSPYAWVMLASLPPLLLPTPRALKLTGGAVSVRINPDVIGSIDTGGVAGASLGADGYRLTISRDAPHVRLLVHSEAGLRHGRATLRQLTRQYGSNLPCLDIHDAPAFPTRGVMLDVSRDKVPTMATLDDAARSFADLKLNHLQLYTEHTFAYAGHDEVWLDCSPVTPDEARNLDRSCRKLGITLAPNQNCFGHLHKWLKLHRYAHLAETQGDWVFMEWPRSGPFSLCPSEPGSIALVRDMLQQLCPCFDAPMVNIGCDETFDIGQGRSRDAAAARGKASVYFDFVDQIAAEARTLGKRPMMWADIALSHPELLGRFPSDAIGLAWGYEPDSDFVEWCNLLGQHGIEPWVCPGTSSWRSITGRTRERRQNLANAGRAAAHGATGYLVTDWGDMGHHQHWPIALNSIAHAAQAAWNPGVPADLRAVSLHVFGDESLELAGWLDRLGDVDVHLRLVGGGASLDAPKPIRNATAMFRDLHRADPLPNPIPSTIEMWEHAAANLLECESSVPASLDRESLLGREVAHTLLTARLAVEHALATRRGCSTALRDWIVDLSRHVLADHETLWLERNRVGGLSRSAAHYQRLVLRMMQLGDG